MRFIYFIFQMRKLRLEKENVLSQIWKFMFYVILVFQEVEVGG